MEFICLLSVELLCLLMMVFSIQFILLFLLPTSSISLSLCLSLSLSLSLCVSLSHSLSLFLSLSLSLSHIYISLSPIRSPLSYERYNANSPGQYELINPIIQTEQRLPGLRCFERTTERFMEVSDSCLFLSFASFLQLNLSFCR